MNLQEMAEVRPRLVAFAAEMLGGLARKDQRAAGARRRRERAGIPGEVRHAGKWRLALEMIDEMTGPGGWGVADEITATGSARAVVVADAGYGDNTTFRLELEDRGWHYVLAVH